MLYTSAVNKLLINDNTPEFSEIFAKVTYEDVTTVAGIKSLDEINLSIGIEVSLLTAVFGLVS